MARTTGHPTLSDVAELAEVSVKTASRALNGEPNVRPEKISRVRSAAKKLGFQRNEMARLLRMQSSSSMVGVITGAIHDPFWAGALGGLESSLGADRFVLSTATEEDPERESAAALAMIERRVMALVIVPSSNDQTYLQPAINAGLPVIAIDRPARGIDIDTITAEDRHGAERGTDLLVEAGHRSIAFIARSSRYTTGERLRGFRRSLTKHQLACDEHNIFTAADDETVVKAALDELASRSQPPTAIFCANVAVTVSTLTHTRAIGWNPGIVAFSDFATSNALSPTITVVNNDPQELGRLAAEVINRRLAGDASAPETIRIATPVIVRESHSQFP